ncbi:MAG: hypothetical protein V7K77_23250 [Nostoc sp.]|uniref:hypothetical protein n=1 Tax=Nostoc sp. TaxID=1180 RepID=UPI002FF53247
MKILRYGYLHSNWALGIGHYFKSKDALTVSQVTASPRARCDRGGDDGRKLVNRFTCKKSRGNTNPDCIKIYRR